MSAIKEKSIHDIQLYHKPKEPVRTRPNNIVGIGKKIIKKSHLTDNIHHMIIVWSVCNSVNHRKSYKANYHHTEKFYPMIFDKTKDWKT